MKNILNDKSKFQEVYIDHDKTLNDLIHMKNRVTDVPKNLRHKKEITIEKYYLIPSQMTFHLLDIFHLPLLDQHTNLQSS